MNYSRSLKTNFWSDTKVSKMSSEKKLLLAYLLTNDSTNLVGCYEFSREKFSFDTKIQLTKISQYLDDFVKNNLIRIDEDSCEILITNWAKHNWNSKESANTYIFAGLQRIKSLSHIKYLLGIYEKRQGNAQTEANLLRIKLGLNEFPSTRTSLESNTRSSLESSVNPVSISDTDSDSISGSVTISDRDSKITPLSGRESAALIIRYLNNRTKSSFPENDESSLKLIEKILDEFSIEDCRYVIDSKSKLWLSDPKMASYLRPSTLFKKEKFIEYLNVPVGMNAISAINNAFLLGDYDGIN